MASSQQSKLLIIWRDFRRSGWSMKAMHRRIMLSNVYQESSAHQPEARRSTRQQNAWRFERRRLKVEAIRFDAFRHGLLNPKWAGLASFQLCRKESPAVRSIWLADEKNPSRASPQRLRF